MLVNSLIGAESWQYNSIDSHVWWPYGGNPSDLTPGIPYAPSGRMIKHIIRESTSPIVLEKDIELIYSGGYNMTAVGPSNESIDWTFYSAVYSSGSYTDPLLICHGDATSNQYGKAKKSLYFVGPNVPDGADVVRVWAETTKYVTFADTIELILYDPT